MRWPARKIVAHLAALYFSISPYVTKVLCGAAPKVNGHALIDCLDAKPKVTPSCDCGALFTCPIVEGIQASESLP